MNLKAQTKKLNSILLPNSKILNMFLDGKKVYININLKIKYVPHPAAQSLAKYESEFMLTYYSYVDFSILKYQGTSIITLRDFKIF